MEMFCRQCEQTAGGTGCTIRGVCGKSADVAVLLDLLRYALTGISVFGQRAAGLGKRVPEVDLFVKEALFSTVTNVNFDPERLEHLIYQSIDMKEKIKRAYLQAYKEKTGKEFTAVVPETAEWKPDQSLAGLLAQGRTVGVLSQIKIDPDISSLKELLLYGLLGMAAYADHAAILEADDDFVNDFFYKGLAALIEESPKAEDLINLVLECGKTNLRCMEILDQAHTSHFGHPVPTAVFLGTKNGPAIIVSGHDLADLEELLKQTQGKNINVYTHGEMLPAHGYPTLKKYKHLVGHFGTAWQNQQKEFENIPAAILMTTNCIQEPKLSYKDRIFTTGLVAWPKVTHIHKVNGRKDFSAVIDKAVQLRGFEKETKEKEIVVGFAHNAVIGVADKVLDLVKKKKIRHFFLIGGCDGARPGRNYYTEFAQKVPADCVILTLACGKYRFNRLDFGDIEGIPRLLDIGQCNDAYSAIQIALTLSQKLGIGVNDLPLSLVLSWYEQKAVVILLTLLSLGIKNIRLGPTLPAFISPAVLKVLVEKFSLKPLSTVDKDLQQILETGHEN